MPASRREKHQGKQMFRVPREIKGSQGSPDFNPGSHPSKPSQFLQVNGDLLDSTFYPMPPNMANMSCRIYLVRVYVSREARRFQMAQAALVCGWSISPGFLMTRGASRALGATALLRTSPAASAKPEFPARSPAPRDFPVF